MKHLRALLRRLFVPLPPVEADLTPRAELKEAEARAAVLAARVDEVAAKVSTYRRDEP